MESKNLAKTIPKFAAIIAGVFILAQAASASYFSFSAGLGGVNCTYCSGDYYPSYSYGSYNYPSYYYDYPTTTTYAYYLGSYSPVRYPYGSYYNTYSVYDYINYPTYYNYPAYYSSYYYPSYYYYPTAYSYYAYPSYIAYYG